VIEMKEYTPYNDESDVQALIQLVAEDKKSQ